jgi:hypothetical protein
MGPVKGMQAGGFEEGKFVGLDVGGGVSEDDAGDVLELTGETEVVEHAVPLVGLGVDIFEEEDGGLGKVKGVGSAERFDEDGEAAAEETALGVAGTEGAEAVGGVDAPWFVGVQSSAPGGVVDAVGVGPVGGGHGGVEGGEMAEIPKIDVQRGVVAVADEGFGVGAEEVGVEER